MQGQQKEKNVIQVRLATPFIFPLRYSFLFFFITSNSNLVYVCGAWGALLLLAILPCARDIHIEWHSNKKKVMLCEKKIEGHDIMKVIAYASNWNVGDVWLISISRPHHFRLVDRKPTEWKKRERENWNQAVDSFLQLNFLLHIHWMIWTLTERKLRKWLSIRAAAIDFFSHFLLLFYKFIRVTLSKKGHLI